MCAQLRSRQLLHKNVTKLSRASLGEVAFKVYLLTFGIGILFEMVDYLMN